MYKKKYLNFCVLWLSFLSIFPCYNFSQYETHLSPSLLWLLLSSSLFGFLGALIFSALLLNMSICDITALHNFIHSDWFFACKTNNSVWRRGLLTGWRTSFCSSILMIIFVKRFRTGGKLSGIATVTVSICLKASLPKAVPTRKASLTHSVLRVKLIQGSKLQQIQLHLRLEYLKKSHFNCYCLHLEVCCYEIKGLPFCQYLC